MCSRVFPPCSSLKSPAYYQPTGSPPRLRLLDSVIPLLRYCSDRAMHPIGCLQCVWGCGAVTPLQPLQTLGDLEVQGVTNPLQSRYGALQTKADGRDHETTGPRDDRRGEGKREKGE